MAHVNLCRCSTPDILSDVKQPKVATRENPGTCLPLTAQTLTSPRNFGLNLDVQSKTGADYSTSTSCHLVRSPNIAEWYFMNDTKEAEAKNDKARSEKQRVHTKRDQEDAIRTTRHRTADTSKKLGERVHDVNYWKFELERMIEEMINEINLLLAQNRRLGLAHNQTQLALIVATDSFEARRRRQDGDLVLDIVDASLMKEIDLIKRCRRLIEETLQQGEKQLTDDRKMKELLEFDWSDKYEAVRTDTECAGLNENSANIQYYNGIKALHPGQSTLQAWGEFSHNNIKDTEKVRLNSIEMRRLIDRVLAETSRDLRQAADDVETAIERRMTEVITALQRLEEQLRQVVQEIADVERTIAELKEAIRQLERPLMLAQTRTYRRQFRPNIEETRDHPQCSLAVELEEIPEKLAMLKRRLTAAEATLRDLLARRTSLEQDIAIKKESIRIDKEKVRVTRTRYPSTTRLAGY